MLQLCSIAHQLILARAAVATSLRKGNIILTVLLKLVSGFEVEAVAKSNVSRCLPAVANTLCPVCAQGGKCMSSTEITHLRWRKGT